MNKSRAVRLNLAILLLFLLPLVSIGWKLFYYKDTLFGKPIAKERLVVSQKFRTEYADRDTTSLLLPSQSAHQRISNENILSSAASFSVKETEGQRCLKYNYYTANFKLKYNWSPNSMIYFGYSRDLRETNSSRLDKKYRRSFEFFGFSFGWTYTINKELSKSPPLTNL